MLFPAPGVHYLPPQPMITPRLKPAGLSACLLQSVRCILKSAGYFVDANFTVLVCLWGMAAVDHQCQASATQFSGYVWRGPGELSFLIPIVMAFVVAASVSG